MRRDYDFLEGREYDSLSDLRSGFGGYSFNRRESLSMRKRRGGTARIGTAQNPRTYKEEGKYTFLNGSRDKVVLKIGGCEVKVPVSYRESSKVA